MRIYPANHRMPFTLQDAAKEERVRRSNARYDAEHGLNTRPVLRSSVEKNHGSGFVTGFRRYVELIPLED